MPVIIVEKELPVNRSLNYIRVNKNQIKSLQKDRSLQKQKDDLFVIDQEMKDSEIPKTRNENARLYLSMNRQMREKIGLLFDNFELVLSKNQ